MYRCESWTIKKAEHQRTDFFELWCWIRLLRVPWTTRRSNQSILKKINPEYPLEGLKLKLQYFSHLMGRADSLEKTLILGKIEGRRRRGWQDVIVGWHHWLNGHEFEQTPRDSEGQGSQGFFNPWGYKESDMTEKLNKNKGWDHLKSFLSLTWTVFTKLTIRKSKDPDCWGGEVHFTASLDYNYNFSFQKAFCEPLTFSIVFSSWRWSI